MLIEGDSGGVMVTRDIAKQPIIDVLDLTIRSKNCLLLVCADYARQMQALSFNGHELS